MIQMMNDVVLRISQCNSFLLISHISPDGDTLGSAAALYHALISMGKKAVLSLDAVVPKKMAFLQESAVFFSPDELPYCDFDCAIAIDTATRARMGRMAKKYDALPVRLNIDHHPTNECFGQCNLILDRASTGEIVLELIERMGVELSVDMANALYAAVSTDTNNFVYSSVTEDTFLAAAKLAKAGAEISRLCDWIYYRRSAEATRLISLGLSRIKLHCGGRVASLYMSLEDINRLGAKKEDCDVLVNYAREIDGVEVAVFVNQMENGRSKVSLRSNSNIDVSTISVEFGGGGHMKASGHVMDGCFEDIISKMVSIIEKQL